MFYFFVQGKTMIGKKLGVYRTQNLLQTDLLCIDISERSLNKSGYLVCFLSINFYVFCGVICSTSRTLNQCIGSMPPCSVTSS